jgi:hypothetical protein
MYPSVYPHRKAQEKQWLEKDAQWFKLQIATIQSKAKKKITHHRINEAGEMKDINCLWKAEDIAAFNKVIGIQTFTYTSRQDLWKEVEHLKNDLNIVINGSGFMAHNEYRVVPEGYKAQKNEYWCPNKCDKCQLCKKRLGVTILAKARHTKKDSK